MTTPEGAAREVTLVLTDLVDSTARVAGLGDEAAARLWAEHDRLARDLLRQTGGLEIDRSDGFLLLFDDAAAALRFALAYHARLAPLGLATRVGLHHGPVRLRANLPEDVARGAKPLEVDGLAKPLAARVMSLAPGGSTLLSAAARTALPGLPPGVALRSHGHYRLKGLSEPVEVFEAGPDGAAFVPPPDVAKAYRVLRDGELWRPLREVPHNLAPERDAFIGRRAELQALADRLAEGERLLTLLGPGGTGKTRLVRRYAMAWLGDWPGGVVFCDLSEARSLEGIHFAVALALGVPLARGDAALQLGHAIASRGRCLVILDNFEQVQPHAAATVGRWLDQAGEAQFVVTSRERLQIAGEQVFAVEPLPLAGDAVELFSVRAQAQRTGFTLDGEHTRDVARIVELLDGLPLAIELAAARARVLSPAQILARLKDRFTLLAGARGAAARQATLRAAIDWSWDLLAPWEQAALAQCAVFEGGFTLEAAEAVLDLRAWPEAPPVLDVVQSLVDKSLLRAWMPKQRQRLAIAEPYFGLYVSIHEYAAERLRAMEGEAEAAAEQRHGGHFARLGSDEAIAQLFGPQGVQRRQSLLLEVDNLAIACRRAMQHGANTVAATLFRALWEALVLQGPFGPAVQLGRAVLGATDLPPGLRIAAELPLADALLRSGRADEARARLLPMLELARATGDRRHEGMVLAQLGHLDREQGRMADAKQRLADAIPIHREAGNAASEAAALHNLGNLHDQQGSPEESRRCHDESLTIYRRLGHRVGVAHVIASQAILLRHLGRMDESRQHYAEALAIYREVGDRRCEGITLGNLGNVLLDQGDASGALDHYRAALGIHRGAGSRTFEAYALSNIALVHQQAGRIDEARAGYEESLAIDLEVANRYHEGMMKTSLGILETLAGNLARAQDHLTAALEIVRGTGDRVTEGTACFARAEVFRRQKRLDDAAEALDRGEVLLREAHNPYELANLLCVRGRTALDAGDHDAAAAALAEAETIAASLAAQPDSALGNEIAALRAAIG